MSRIESKTIELILQRRWWIIFFTLCLVGFTGTGVSRLTVDSDLRIFFSEHNPQLKALEALENTYTKSETILIAVAPKSAEVFANDTLAAVEALTSAAWKIPYSNRVESLTNFQSTRGERDELIVEDFISDARTLPEQVLQKKKVVALREPLLVNRLLSPDTKVTGINVTVVFPDKSALAVAQVAEHTRHLVAQFQNQYPQLDFHLTGSIMFDVAFSEVAERDMVTLTPIMLLVLIFTVGLSIRSISATLMTLLVIVFSMLTAMGLAGWLGISINPASANAPTIILTLAVADSVHILLMTYRLIDQGMPKQQAIAESLRYNLQAVFLTSVTTCIGFATMNYSDAPPFRDLGNIVALGIGAAFVYSIFFLPAMTAVLPTRLKLKPDRNSSRFFTRLANFVSQHPASLAWSLSLTAVLVSLMGVKNQLNDDWIKYFSDNVKVRVATDYFEDHLSGSDYIEYSVACGSPDCINDPNYLEKLDAFSSWLRAQPHVVHVFTITDILKRLNKNLHADSDDWYRLPRQRDLAAQYLLLYEMSLPLGLDLNNQINVEKSATRVVVTLKSKGTKALLELDTIAQTWLIDHTPPPMHAQGTGLSMVWAYLSQRNIINMLGAAFGALLAISAILIYALKRIDIGLISIVPNLAPAGMAFGLWGMFDGQVGLGLSVVVSMTLGIVVDDTIHFISKYLRIRRRENVGAVAAVHHAFSTAGPAMWITTVALVAGFLVLTFSDYRMSADMGLLCAVTISIALVMDFLLLPALLLCLDRSKKYQ